MKKVLLVGALLAAGLGNAMADNLIKNGDFETTATFYGTNDPNHPDFQPVGVGGNFITNWTVGGNSVDVIKHGYGAIMGNSIDLQGSPGPGSISQSFMTLAGMMYQLDFDLFHNSVTGFANVSVGSAMQGYTSLSTDPIRHISLLFTAADPLTSLKISSDDASQYSGATVDNISVTAIPEPETYALMLAGIGFVAFMVRRRKQQQQEQHFGNFAAA